MAMSGIDIDPKVKSLFDEIKLKAIHKYATFKIADDGKSVIPDILGDKADTTTMEDDCACFEVLMGQVQVDEPRFILYDFGFVAKSGRKVNKLAFIFWCDDNAPIKKKMKYASTKDSVTKVFSGIAFQFQANDMEDFNYENYAVEVEKKA